MALAVVDARPTGHKKGPHKGKKTGHAIKIHNNPQFRPNATRQIVRAWKKFSQHTHSSKIGQMDVGTIPFTDVCIYTNDRMNFPPEKLTKSNLVF